MEKIQRFNLDIALFNKELNAFIETVNEIDDETNNLLIETVIAVDRLQNSKFREISSSHQKNFALNLDDEIFEFRRYVVCRLCHENIPLCSEDFESHIQKKSHKEREIGLKSTLRSVNSNGNDSALITRNTSINRRNNLSHEQSTPSNTNSPTEALASGSLNGMSRSISFDSLQLIPEKVCVTQKWENVIQAEDIFKAISTKIVEITGRTENRNQNEVKIVSLLTCCLREFDPTSKIIRIGSSTYGFGGADTDFNVIINTTQNPIVALHSFEKIFKSSVVQTQFEAITTIDCDRVQKRRLQAIHKESRIVCVVQFSSSNEMSESSQVIRDAIVHTPLCFHLIAYIRCWQDALNEAAAQKEMSAFQFNTYIISVFVIFFLQYKKEFPEVKKLPKNQIKCINKVCVVNGSDVKQSICEFFEFYGNKYEPKNQMISIHIGKWQDRQLLARKTATVNLTPEQNSWRDGILANSFNWENCAMYVQDIKSPGTNIVADISKEHANNFKVMCKIFSSVNSCDKINVEYLSKMAKFEPICGIDSILRLDNVDPTRNTTRYDSSMSLLPSLKDAVASLEKLDLMQPSCSNGSSAVSTCSSPRISTAKSLEDIINIEEVTKMIQFEMDQILSRSPGRICNEHQIIEILSFHFKARQSVKAILPFGSTTFGFGGQRTNLNILVLHELSGPLQRILQTAFANEVKTIKDFEYGSHVEANRVRMDQLKIVHRNSRIECLVESCTVSSLHHIEKASKIIVDYMNIHQMCKPLIAYVRAWQTVLNDVATRNGLQMFQINSYIISVLVIFYMQMNHKIPVLDELSSMIANKTLLSSEQNLSDFIKDFFHFYGTTFENRTHIISANVGRWQQINSPGQIHFTPQQKSMRDGIMQCPGNWTNCSMYVQDLVSPSINITAELSMNEVDNFVKMCKIFAKYEPIVGSSYLNRISSANSMSSLKSRSSVDKVLPHMNDSQNTNVVSLIENEIVMIRSRSSVEVREGYEMEICASLMPYIRKFDSSLDTYPCGSIQYDIRLLNSNYNLLINTHGRKAKDVSQQFFFRLEKTDIFNHFKQLRKISANRAICRQISLIHIKSGIQCTIFFAKDKTIVKSTDIISRYTKDPLCNFLITFVRIWQNTLNQTGIAHFQFNTYIVSVLVIFFLQMEFGEASFPTVDKLLTTTAQINTNIPNFKPVLRQFFHFYGNQYQIWNHVISINIGQWHELRAEPHIFSLAQKRLLDGIKASPENWTNCGMFVQDVVRPDINITAEISKKAAANFQQMCKQFIEKTN